VHKEVVGIALLIKEKSSCFRKGCRWYSRVRKKKKGLGRSRGEELSDGGGQGIAGTVWKGVEGQKKRAGGPALKDKVAAKGRKAWAK